MSHSDTVIASVSSSMSTCPKNCSPALGGRWNWPGGGALAKTSCGPKVGSSSFGPKVPAFSGPETNSQNGAKSE